ncbi:MAG: sugar transferase [Phycisphaerae bacterium]|nr:sugar transferase [Phycisphaerae bacterium]
MASSKATTTDWAAHGAQTLPASWPGVSSARDRAYEIAKRAVDVVGSLIALALFLPVMALAAVLVMLTSPGPVFFRQSRAGRYGKPFRMYKFRSMVESAEDDKELFRTFNELPTGPCFKIKHDPRVTWVGRHLRRSSIDELPQLLNVLLGDMSLVGPRPLPLDEVRYDTPDQILRMSVKPGLTCLWQISGRTEIPYEEWLALDVWYIRNRTFVLDLQIMLKTLPAILTGHGAY